MKQRASLGFGIAVLLLGLFVYAVGWDDVLGAAARADLGVYALAFVSVTCCLGFRSMTWVRVLRTVGVIIPRRLVTAVFLASTFVKYVTPYGQVAASPGIAYVLSRYSDVNYEEDFAAVLSADFLNYLPYYSFGAFGAGYVVWTSPRTPDLGGYAVAAPVMVTGIAAALAVFWFRRDFVERTVIRIVSPTRRIVGIVSEERAARLTREGITSRIDGFYETLDLVTTSRRDVLVALGYAHLGWLGFALALYSVALALDAPLSLGGAMLAVALSKLGFVVPLPGGLGGVELTIAGVLFLIAPISPAVATAIAILYRLAAYWFPVLLGGMSSIVLSWRG